MNVVQSSKFGFIEGEGEPTINNVGSGVDTIRLEVDRPFYAICVDKNTNFPMFVNKVNNPTK